MRPQFLLACVFLGDKGHVVMSVTSGGNSKTGVDSLTQPVFGVSEKVFYTMLEMAKEENMDKCIKCKGKVRNKRGPSLSSLELRSTKRARSQHHVGKNNVSGSSSGIDIPVCGFCNKCHDKCIKCEGFRWFLNHTGGLHGRVPL
ncbi:hypothetical protein PVK06_048319 [Gossypium arboreum]|uniref:Uncharacterized protein n=1 Tax=Gossypium arboreum TaxID=29729 RepID=A0ABR0MG01_GOSAR|nr:hypothetical protein PVK06_048319 [Gossypium arboreum]